MSRRAGAAEAQQPEGAEKAWSYSYGERPHTGYARELPDKGGVIQVRYTDPSLPGRDKRARKHLHMPLRRRPDGPVDPGLERLAKEAIKGANARLVAGLPPFAEPPPVAPPPRQPAAASPETLTIAEGFELALHPEQGNYPLKNRHAKDVASLRDTMLAPGMLDPNLRWVDLTHDHVVALWRRAAALHKREGALGDRRVEVMIGNVYVIAERLRRRGKIPTSTAIPAKAWRKEFYEEWGKLVGPTEPYRPRHTPEEALAIYGHLWHPDRVRYRALLAVAKDGAARALPGLTREHVVRDAAGQPVALRFRIERSHRAGGTASVSVRLHLDRPAREATAAVDHAGDRHHLPRPTADRGVCPPPLTGGAGWLTRNHGRTRRARKAGHASACSTEARKACTRNGSSRGTPPATPSGASDAR